MRYRYSHPASFDYKKPLLNRPTAHGARLFGSRGRLVVAVPLACSAVLLMGGGIVLAKRLNPANLAGQAALKTQSNLNQSLVKSFSQEGIQSATVDASLTFSGPGIPAAFNSLNIDGTFNRAGQADLMFTTDLAGIPISLHEIRLDEDHQYSRVAGISDVNTLQRYMTDPAMQQSVQAAAPVIVALNGKWFNIDEELLSQLTAAATGGIAGMPTSQASRVKIVELYKQHPFVKQKRQLVDDLLDGVPVEHIEVVIDRPKLQAFLVAARGEGGPLANMDSVMFQKMWHIIRTTDFNVQPFDVWFEKDTHYFRRVAASLETAGYMVNLELTLSNINQPVKVQAPAGALDTNQFLDILSPLVRPL